ncbi:MAG: fluoride efflux transporter CrcB [Gammaproteobacteria bacterium]
MKAFLAVAIGGALGAASRYATGLLTSSLLGTTFPFAVLLVNISGSFAIGCLFPLVSQPSGHSVYHALLMVGFLGAFTTFSTFSLDTIQLLESGQAFKAMANVLSNVILCLVACWLGLSITR